LGELGGGSEEGVDRAVRLRAEWKER
jgi:hypothetical protein